MVNKNKKVSNNSIKDVEYKLTYFDEGLLNYVRNTPQYRNKVTRIADNLIRLKRGSKYIFYMKYHVCPYCKDSNCKNDGFVDRKLYILHENLVNCRVKRYYCYNCNRKFRTDLSSLVNGSSNITNEVIEIIREDYANYKASIYSIQKTLKRRYNIALSHESVEKIILSSQYDIRDELGRFSGNYIFDALWVKENCKWKYLLVLFDTKFNTAVSFKLVDSESEEEIYLFLSESTYKKERKTIVTDLKDEYRKPIWKLGFKHQFCIFHAEQKINRDIRKYISNNELSDAEEEEIKYYKKVFFSLLGSKDVNDAKRIRDELICKNNLLPEPIYELLWDFIVPYFKNLTLYMENLKVEPTSNKLENLFQKVFGKHFKKRMKSSKGIVSRFALGLREWDFCNLLGA